MQVAQLSVACRAALQEIWTSELNPTKKRFLALGLVASTTTLNDGAMLGEWIPRFDGILDQEAIEEAVLQTLLFAGYPKTIEALKIIRKHFPQASAGKQVDNHKVSGHTTSKIIYGEHHARLIQIMDELHPDLTRWMIEDGYGRVLSRPGLSLQEREITVIAALMSSGMVNQYGAHIRGALFTGIEVDDIIWFTNVFGCIIAVEMRAAFEKVTNKILATVNQ